MAKLIYSAITSLDGYTEDEEGKFDWAAPDIEVHAFVNELQRPVGVYLYGRRMYETMVYWETAGREENQPAVSRDFAEMWRSAEKVVYSRTLEAPSSARTRVQREFDLGEVKEMKLAGSRDITIGGPGLAAQALAAGVVDECHLFVAPVLVGGGKRAMPRDVRARLELLDQRRFSGGFVYLRYRIAA